MRDIVIIKSRRERSRKLREDNEIESLNWKRERQTGKESERERWRKKV